MMMKWNIKSKRFLIVGVVTLAWICLLIGKEDTAITLAPYTFGLIAAYCGFDSWKSHNGEDK